MGSKPPLAAPRRPRPARRWSFERLETRRLLSAAPPLPTPGQLAQARPIAGGFASGLLAAGQVALFRVDPKVQELLLAQVHAPGATDRLALLDASGRLIAQSDGESASRPDPLLGQHVAPGAYFLEVEGLAGAGPFTLTAMQAASTAPSGNIPIDGTPIATVTGDFNGDGHLDMAVTFVGYLNLFGRSSSENGLDVFLGNGDGTFRAPVEYAKGSTFGPLAVGDFLGNGRVDLVTLTATGIDVFAGNGDGTFAAPLAYATGLAGATTAFTATSGPQALVAGDFSGDGRLDLAFGFGPTYVTAPDSSYIQTSQGGVAVMTNLGGGTFGAPQVVASSFQPISLVAGDFQGDGRVDLAFDDSDILNAPTPIFGASVPGVAVLLNDGGGHFEAPVAYLLGPQLQAMTVGDFNGDGRADLAVVSSVGGPGITGQVDVLMANPGGTFQAPVAYTVGANPTALVAGDFAGDGRVDLAVDSADGLETLVGDGAGSFRPSGSTASSFASSTQAFALGDFNGDHRADLALLFGSYQRNPGSPASIPAGISILLGEGDGTFRATVAGNSGLTPAQLVEGDFNGDGRADLAATSHNGITLFLNNGDGTFQAASGFAEGTIPFSLVVGDFNGDGRLDLAYIVATIGAFYGQATTPSAVDVLLGNGDGTFQASRRYASGAGATSLVAGDFGGDGRTDLAFSFPSTTVENVIDAGPGSSPNGGFGFVGPYPSTDQGADPSAPLDLPRLPGGLPLPVVLSIQAGSDSGSIPMYYYKNATTLGGIAILSNRGDGTFGHPIAYGLGSGASALAAGDFNGDGRVDLAALPTSPSDGPTPPFRDYGVVVFLNDGRGAFSPPVGYAPGLQCTAIVAGDFSGDGRSDLALAYAYNTAIGYAQGASGVAVLGSNPDGTFGVPVDFEFADNVLIPNGSPSGLLDTIVVGDFAGDGHLDLAVNVSEVLYSTPASGFGLAPGDVVILRGVGDGTFRPPVAAATGTGPTSLVAGDFSGDGRSDLAFAGSTGPGFQVLLGRGDGSFADPLASAIGSRATPLLADLAGTGGVDAIVVDQSGDILWRRGRPGHPGQFDPPIAINPGRPALDVAIVDLPRGRAVAAVDSKDDAVTVYLDEGPAFGSVAYLRTGSLPAQVTSGDLDGDGSSDLVVRNAGDGTVSIFLGDGRGGFRRMADVPVGPGASDVALADLDGDGRPDLIVTGQVSGDVRVFPDLGGGAFGAPSRRQAGGGPYGLDPSTGDLSSQDATSGVASGRFRAGGRLGLAIINPGSNTLAVLDGLGGGALANARAIKTTGRPRVIRAFAANGLDDLAVLGSDGLTIYLAGGDGGFARGQTLAVGPAAGGLSVGDVNGDGLPDLIVGNGFGDVLALLGNGDGTFRPYQAADRKIALASADLRGLGEADFIFADQGLDRVSVQYGGAAPAVLAGPSQGILAPGAVTLADLNRDGKPDLVVANSGSNNVLVYLGLGDGQFGPALNGGHGFFTGTNPVGVTVADLNGDGVPDLVVANQGSDDVSILIGQGAGGVLTFVAGPRLKAGAGPVATVVRDVNGDGLPDLLVSDAQANQVRLLAGVGRGFFDDQSPRAFDVGLAPGPLFVGRFEGPAGRLDLVTINAGSDDITVIPDFLGGGQARSMPSGGLGPSAALAGDFSGDGLQDLVVANGVDGRLAFFLGGFDGLGLAQAFSSPELPNPTSLAFASSADGLVSFYAGTEGVEAATLLSFRLLEGTATSPGGGGEAFDGPPDAPGVESVAVLQPLGGASLSVLATLLTVTVEPGPSQEGPGSAAESTSTATTAALPNQPTSREESEGDDDGGGPDGPPAGPDEPAPAASAIARFFFGLDEAFEEARAESARARQRPGVAERAFRALDAILDRWEPAPGPPPEAPAEPAQVPAPPAEPAAPEASAFATSSIAIAAIARTLGDRARRPRPAAFAARRRALPSGPPGRS